MARWAVIAIADNSWKSGPLDTQPVAGTGERVIPVVAGYPSDCLWSPSLNGFVDITGPTSALTPAAFMLLFTQAERMAIRTALTTNPQVADFWQLIAGAVSGVALSDAWIKAGVQQLVTFKLLTSTRATAVLAGTPPTS